MSDRLPIEITALAASHIRSAAEWWRVNRALAPTAVDQELERVLALISRQPRIGSRAANVKLAGARRIYLPIIKHHLYYLIVPAPERVRVIALWHTRRGKGPPV
jgi:plasmid stabilization system protein ParE